MFLCLPILYMINLHTVRPATYRTIMSPCSLLLSLLTIQNISNSSSEVFIYFSFMAIIIWLFLSINMLCFVAPRRNKQVLWFLLTLTLCFYCYYTTTDFTFIHFYFNAILLEYINIYFYIYTVLLELHLLFGSCITFMSSLLSISYFRYNAAQCGSHILYPCLWLRQGMTTFRVLSNQLTFITIYGVPWSCNHGSSKKQNKKPTTQKPFGRLSSDLYMQYSLNTTTKNVIKLDLVTWVSQLTTITIYD